MQYFICPEKTNFNSSGKQKDPNYSSCWDELRNSVFPEFFSITTTDGSASPIGAL